VAFSPSFFLGENAKNKWWINKWLLLGFLFLMFGFFIRGLVLAGLVTRLVHSLAILALVQVHPAKRHSTLSFLKRKLTKTTGLCDEQKSAQKQNKGRTCSIVTCTGLMPDSQSLISFWWFLMADSNFVPDGLD